jgi:rRNA maturation protein Nop10
MSYDDDGKRKRKHNETILSRSGTKLWYGRGPGLGDKRTAAAWVQVELAHWQSRQFGFDARMCKKQRRTESNEKVVRIISAPNRWGLRNKYRRYRCEELVLGFLNVNTATG